MSRVWQTDFTEFETHGGGIWRISGAVDYVCKVMLTARTSMNQTAADAIESLEQAREQASRWLGRPLIEDLVDPATGELVPITGREFGSRQDIAWFKVSDDRHRARNVPPSFWSSFDPISSPYPLPQSRYCTGQECREAALRSTFNT